MATRILFLVVGLSISSLLTAHAQRNMSWRKHRKAADELFEQGKYAEAAQHYESAWQKKKKKEELIFNAGECYYLINDYRKAANAYQNVKDMNDDFPLVGLKYARSLKQDGQYDKAKDAFENFLDGYTGESKQILNDIIKTEIQGCELGMRLPMEINQDIEMGYPGTGVNSESTEFAPFPFSNNVLYFSSTMGGQARIYRSQHQGERWSKAAIPENFPVIQNNQHFCNGVASPDGSRFYFTICSGDQSWNNLTSRCEIFVIKRRGNTWSQPERLPDFINMENTTATQPSIVHEGGREIMYFVSNREGGRGGMDIWYTSRDLGNDNSEFSFPVNLGGIVNTLGDEITPFYDSNEGMLYFASNGQVSIGGFDIFTSTGDGTRWAPPENAGLPINSSANDYGYVLNDAGSQGFLVSNRLFGSRKTTTRDVDIFEFSTGEQQIVLQGNVYEMETGNPMNNVMVSLYEVNDAGTETLVDQKNFTNGSYLFDVEMGKRFKVTVESIGYEPYTFQFMTDDPELNVYGQPVQMTKKAPPSPETVENDATEEPAYPEDDPDFDNTARETYTINDGYYEIVTDAPRHNGTYYRVQLVALKRYNADSEAFSIIREIGQIETEYITERELTRVLLGDYFTKEEASAALNLAKQHGFDGAYVVQYEDGMRQGRIKL
jgi:hypothetical protein